MTFTPRLTKIGVGGFKSIKNLQPLEMGALTVLIGANGAGKSNFVSLFRVLEAISRSRLQQLVDKAGGANEFLHYGAAQTPFIWISVSMDAKPDRRAITFI